MLTRARERLPSLPMYFFRALPAVLGLTWLGCSTAFAAQEAPVGYPECNRVPSESEVSAAKGAFEAGQVSFHEADYGRAILFWEDAFRRDCTALALLLNLARVYELAEDYEHASVAVSTYLERNPSDPNRAALELRLQHLTAKRDAKRAESDRLEAAKLAPAAEVAAPQTNSAPIPAEPPPPSPSRARPILPVAITGLGAVATGIGLGFLIPGQISVSNYASGLCSGRSADGAFACSAELAENGTVIRTAGEVETDANAALTQRNIGIVVTSIGAATAVTGAVFWMLTWRSGEPTPTNWTPWMGPGLMGVTYSNQF